MAVLHVGPLPDEAVEAAAQFHATILPRIVDILDEGDAHLVLVFEPGDKAQRGWRLAAVQALARRYAPHRVNALEADAGDGAAVAAAERYLDAAPGVTGQLLPLDSHGAGEVIASGE